MRKLSLSLMTVLFSIALVFTGCEKDETASPVNVDTFKTAVLKGYVKAEYDNTASGYETAVGIKVKVSVEYDDLTTDYDASGYWSTIVETDADGVFEVEVPATEDGVYVYYEVLSFEKEVKVSSSVKENHYFYYSGNDVYTYADQLEVVEFYLYSEAVGNE